ncbi:MAG: PAS domain S-box protein, partial [Blastocatellia bacterium]
MCTAIEHAGAQRGVLVLSRADERWIAAEATTSEDKVVVRLAEASVAGASLPESIVRYVARTRESVILDDASAQNPFGDDRYIKESVARSVLCLPLINPSNLIGVLYLENNLASHVFTPPRVTVLKLLASLAAISLENTGLYRDIEEREAILRESEARLHAFFGNSPNVIFLKDRQGRYLYVNNEFNRAYKIAGKQVEGKTDEELFPGEQAAEFHATDQKVLDAAIAMEFEEVSQREDGLHTNIVQKFPLFDAAGDIYAVGCIATDITERKREESARRYSDERYRVVVETASDVVISSDDNGIILLANPATERIFGYEPSELIGKPLTILMPAFMRERHENGFRRYLATGERHINWLGTELIGQRKNGDTFPVEVSFGELISNGHRVFTGFIRDISEKKRAEEALRRSEAYLAEAQR